MFIGPNDLSLSLLGYTPANFADTALLQAISNVVASAKRYGKKVGILSTDGEAAKKAKEMFDLIVLNTDVRTLQAWYGKELNIARS